MVISKHTRKIMLSFIVVLGLFLAMILFDLNLMNIMQAKHEVITKEHNIKSDLMMTMHHGIYERQVSLRNIILMNDAFDKDKERMVFNSYALKISNARNTFSKLPLNKEEKKLLEDINVAMARAYRAQNSTIKTHIYGDPDEITKSSLDEVFKIQKVIIDQVKQMITLQKIATKTAVVAAGKSYRSAKLSVYIFGSSALLFGLFVALYVVRLTESQARDVNAAMSEIEKSHHLLEDRVQKRTEELADARDVAITLNKTKDNFIATMSHELRTPLNIIIGYSEILEETAIEEKQNSFIPDIKKIQAAANHQLKLVSSILDISKIEEGKLEIYPIEFDVEQLVDEIEAAAKPLMSKNNNIFKINCLPGIGMMYSDNMRIRQILLNVLSNAAKFTEQGVVSLTITKDVKNGEIKFEVKDSGIGISESYISRLFSRFTQEDSSTTRKYGGSGLGLSISEKLSQLLNGNITVVSEEGKGACFTVKLPIIYSV